ncbi:MAG: acyl-CoA thioesterase [Oscillospiraceae bacterium]|nr:acyl-CoA thioesterase [Oscillospiraceae bacterium]
MHIYTRKVQYYETDKMNFVHHSNYIRWFEESRVDYLESIGLPFDKMEADGLLSPVLEMNCKYHRACTFGDTVDIAVAMTRFERLRFGFAYRVTDHARGTLLAEGSSMHCFMNAAGRPVALERSAPQLAERFAAVHIQDTAQWEQR